eukprot:comp22601_c2_seq1/m.34662 comp22601_c2_seq1/g.34662  ORF comp22601_c2_seq1/g.34662 comp22601_c2_seq1/m.34662 type:complete len:300 (+) comp22601_c2_seq1:590-1489(+)
MAPSTLSVRRWSPHTTWVVCSVTFSSLRYPPRCSIDWCTISRSSVCRFVVTMTPRKGLGGDLTLADLAAECAGVDFGVAFGVALVFLALTACFVAVLGESSLFVPVSTPISTSPSPSLSFTSSSTSRVFDFAPFLLPFAPAAFSSLSDSASADFSVFSFPVLAFVVALPLALGPFLLSLEAGAEGRSGSLAGSGSTMADFFMSFLPRTGLWEGLLSPKSNTGSLSLSISGLSCTRLRLLAVPPISFSLSLPLSSSSSSLSLTRIAFRFTPPADFLEILDAAALGGNLAAGLGLGGGAVG